MFEKLGIILAVLAVAFMAMIEDADAASNASFPEPPAGYSSWLMYVDPSGDKLNLVGVTSSYITDAITKEKVPTPIRSWEWYNTAEFGHSRLVPDFTIQYLSYATIVADEYTYNYDTRTWRLIASNIERAWGSVDILPESAYKTNFGFVNGLFPVGDKEPPSKPTGLKIESFDDRSAVLSWDGAQGATSYNVYLVLSSGPIFVGETSDSTYTITGLAPNNNYSAYVTGVNSKGESSKSDAITFKTDFLQDENTENAGGFLMQLTGLIMPPQLQNAWTKLNAMDTKQTKPPKFTVDLGGLYMAAVSKLGYDERTDRFVVPVQYNNGGSYSPEPKPIDGFSNSATVVDFAVLEKYEFGGLNLIEYFRMIIGFGMVLTTFLYAWRKIIPRNVLD